MNKRQKDSSDDHNEKREDLDHKEKEEKSLTADSYQKSKEYWAVVEPTVNGMLGGYPQVSYQDVRGSSKFLSEYFIQRKQHLRPSSLKIDSNKTKAKLALDVGAGIGRVTKLLLLSFSEVVDLLEQNESFLNSAVEYMGLPDEVSKRRIGKLICSSLQDFVPEKDRVYDIIWIQWVTGYLNDDDLCAFFTTCKSCLNPESGLIVLKDNTTLGDAIMDMNDSSVTRPLKILRQIMRKSGLSLIKEERQTKFPSGLLPVYMFALK